MHANSFPGGTAPGQTHQDQIHTDGFPSRTAPGQTPQEDFPKAKVFRISGSVAIGQGTMPKLPDSLSWSQEPGRTDIIWAQLPGPQQGAWKLGEAWSQNAWSTPVPCFRAVTRSLGNGDSLKWWGNQAQKQAVLFWTQLCQCMNQGAVCQHNKYGSRSLRACFSEAS